jgi:hypothetical protein
MPKNRNRRELEPAQENQQARLVVGADWLVRRVDPSRNTTSVATSAEGRLLSFCSPAGARVEVMFKKSLKYRPTARAAGSWAAGARST